MITSKDEGQNAERPCGVKSGRVHEIRIRVLLEGSIYLQ